MDGKGLSSGSRKRSCRRGQDSGEWRAQRTRFRRPANLLFVPARSKDVAVVKYREGVLPLVLAGFRVDYHVLHPTPGFGSPQQVIAIEVACRIHPQAGIPSPQHGVVVGNGKAAFTIDDEDVPLAVHALPGVVVFDGFCEAHRIVKVNGLCTTASV